MSQRVVVTGGAGFIGAVLVERLLAEGHHVAVLDNFWRGSMANLRSVADHAHLTVVEGDVTLADDLERCRQALGEVDLVHHLAAINGTKWFDEAALDVIDVNINGTLVALRKAQDWGARFVLASSPEAFGENEGMPLRNDDISQFPSASQHSVFPTVRANILTKSQCSTLFETAWTLVLCAPSTHMVPPCSVMPMGR